MKTKRTLIALGLALSCTFALEAGAEDGSMTADEAYTIAKEAYVFCFPLNYYYRTVHAQVLDPTNKRSLGGFGKWRCGRSPGF
jgi:hypothetical protein